MACGSWGRVSSWLMGLDPNSSLDLLMNSMIQTYFPTLATLDAAGVTHLGENRMQLTRFCPMLLGPPPRPSPSKRTLIQINDLLKNGIALIPSSADLFSPLDMVCSGATHKS